MRKFIISDIHGFGNFYYTVMKYLDKISETEEIELYINGDLIDRGDESAEILLDVIKRIKENKFKIEYLGGNHELMMYKVLEERKRGFYLPYFSDWYYNGGYITDRGLKSIVDEEKMTEISDFISNLRIYHKFRETINNKPIVLIHAACLANIKDECDMFIKNDDKDVKRAVWTREIEKSGSFLYDLLFARRKKIGNDKYFTIIGHTPVFNRYGFIYNKQQNCLNIDGGCGAYASGYLEYDHFPLVEVCDNYLRILTFNSDNELVYGNYFYDNKAISFKKEELEDNKKILIK